MSFSSKKSSGSKGGLNKKIPENPRYKNIKSTIDTGASVSKYLERLEDLRTNYRYRNDEIFKRLKVTTFAQLILQVAEVNLVDDVDTPLPSDMSSTLAGSPITSPSHIADYPESPPDTARSTLSSVISGVGELDINQSSSLPSSPTPVPELSTCPYLLLDVRYKEDYEQCHIISAKSYPVSMLSRSCNYFTKEILDYQNKPGKIIILYDEDERIAPNAATTFVQRGIDNIFMLSGGMRVLYKTFPKGVLSGTVPDSCKTRKPSSSISTRYTAAAHGTHGDNFTKEDLAAIQDKLDEALLSSSRASSRTSSSISHRSASVRDSIKPWK